jgi:hypothetical protein
MRQAIIDRAQELKRTETYRSACDKIRCDSKWHLESLGALDHMCFFWEDLQRDTGLTDKELVYVKIVQIIGTDGSMCKYDAYST